MNIDRTKVVGASDVPIILGISPFCTPLQLWMMKKGIAESSNQTEPMYWGTKKEQIIAERFSEDHGVKLIAWKKRYIHKDMPFFSCELDRIIVGEDTIVECKSTTEYKKDDWGGDSGELPGHIIAQVQAQMGLSNRKKTWVACLIGSSTYVEKLVEFDAEIYDVIVARVKDFWYKVENDIQPEAMAGDDGSLLSLYPNSDDQLQSIQEMESAVALRQEIAGQIKDLKDQQAEVEVKLKEAIGDSLGLKTEKYVVKWTPTTTKRIDTKAVKDAGIYDQYAVESSSRRLTIKLNKVGK